MTYNEKVNECLAAIKNGDHTKFSELYYLTYARLKSVAQSYLINKSQAEYVLSDVYQRIHIYADRYNTSKSAITYLWQIVKNRAFDYNRQLLKNKTVSLDEIEIAEKIDPFELENAKIDIAKALTKLDPTNALIIVWTYRDGLTQDEIGERLKITKSAVCQRLSKSRKKLFEYLK